MLTMTPLQLRIPRACTLPQGTPLLTWAGGNSEQRLDRGQGIPPAWLRCWGTPWQGQHGLARVRHRPRPQGLAPGPQSCPTLIDSPHAQGSEGTSVPPLSPPPPLGAAPRGFRRAPRHPRALSHPMAPPSRPHRDPPEHRQCSHLAGTPSTPLIAPPRRPCPSTLPHGAGPPAPAPRPSPAPPDPPPALPVPPLTAASPSPAGCPPYPRGPPVSLPYRTLRSPPPPAHTRSPRPTSASLPQHPPPHRAPPKTFPSSPRPTGPPRPLTLRDRPCPLHAGRSPQRGRGDTDRPTHPLPPPTAAPRSLAATLLQTDQWRARKSGLRAGPAGAKSRDWLEEDGRGGANVTSSPAAMGAARGGPGVGGCPGN